MLLVSYQFPPLGGGGVLRAAKFAKYLPECGWEPEVLTVGEARFHLRDDAALAEIACPVHRVPDRRYPSAAQLLRVNRESAPRPVETAEVPIVGWRGRLRTLLARLGDLPDQQAPWLPPARAWALQLARQGRYGVIWTTSPPASDHLLGLAVKRRTGLPWVADLRDSWTLGSFFTPATPLHRILSARWERRVMEEADAVVCVTPRMAERYREAYPFAAGRIVVITNGYDEADFDGLNDLDPLSGTPLAYAGTFYDARRPEALLAALEQVADERPAAGLCLHEAGTSGLEAETALNALARRRPDLLQRHGNLPHRQALELAARSRVNVLVIGRQPGAETVLTGKLFEYLRLGRPILACCPPGDAADLITRLGAGVVAAPDAPAEIVAGLRRLLDAPSPPPDRAAVAAFDRRRLTADLARLLAEMVERTPSRLHSR